MTRSKQPPDAKENPALLEGSENVLRELAENITQVFYVRDIPGKRMLYVSPAYEKIWGRPVQAVYDNPLDFVTLIHPDDRQRIQEGMALQEQRGFFDDEYRIVREDGTVRWIHIRTFPIHDEYGHVYRVAGLADDVTERKCMETQIAEALAERENLLASIPDIIYALDTTGRLVSWNRRVEDVTGLDRETLRQCPATAFFPENYQEAVRDAIAAAMRHGYTELEAPMITADGLVPYYFTGALMTGIDGETLGVTGVGRDMSELRRAEAALRQSEARFRLLFENAPVGIAINSLDHGYITANHAYCEMTGYTVEELRNLRFEDITHPEDRLRETPLAEGIHRGEIPFLHMEKRYIRKNGELFWVRLSATIITDSDGTPLYGIGFAEDINERKRAEEERLERERSHREALVREVHHRIKNHLQGLSGLLHQHAMEHPELAQPLQTVMSQIRSVAVVHGLESAGPGGEPRLGDMMEAIATAAMQISGATVTLEILPPAEQLQVSSRDAVSVALVLNELLANAIKHSHSGVQVRIAPSNNGGAVTITNCGALPAVFDFTQDQGLGTGLRLLRTLLPRRGAELSIRQAGDIVEAILSLQPTVLTALAEARDAP